MPLFGRNRSSKASAQRRAKSTSSGTGSPQALEDTTFTDFLHSRTERLADLCVFAQKYAAAPEFPCRDYLSHLNREARQLEELVDGHGAQNNEKWFPFRESIAAAKFFSEITHETLHIQQGIQHYDLMGAEEELGAATAGVIDLLRQALARATKTILDQLDRCGLESTPEEPAFKPCRTEALGSRLPADRSVRHSEKVGETVVFLSTQFLNLSEDQDVTEVLKQRNPKDYARFIPEPISEERLRLVESRFHNLQSLYDTYIFESDIEQQNRSLRTLRGHISLIFHFFSIATDLAHYYIRHMSSLRRETFLRLSFPLSEEDMRSLLFEYPLAYAKQYLDSATNLCQSMIREYSEQKTVEVPIPNYRGFHVRPSTLIAKIVRHYGSQVTMELDGQEYDAAQPFDLFRANEAINAVKRRQAADMLDRESELQQPVPEDPEERNRELQLLFLRLMREGHIMVYDSDVRFEDLEAEAGETLAEFAARYVVHLMSVGKLDVQSDITVRFSGDSRAVNDLEILANNGYGEDDIGNNIVLPPELSYITR